MKKPEFPKPRIIREGLLPEQDTIETKPMPTPKETYEYCEYLINEELNSLIDTAYLNKEGEALERFKQELKELYKHLENIQSMKTSYLSGR